MIADIYNQCFHSLFRLRSKRSSFDSLPHNHNLNQVQFCNSVILNILAQITSQSSIYRHYWLSRALTNHPPRGKFVDTPVTLILRMGYGAWHFIFWVGIWPTPHIWSSASNRHVHYLCCKTENHWRAIDYHVQDGARSVSLLFLVIKVANSSKKENCMQKLIFCD